MPKTILSTPIVDPLTGFLIQTSDAGLYVDPEGELTQILELRYFTNNNGAYGIPAEEHIDTLDYSPEEKARLKSQYTTRTIRQTTAGNMVDPVTKERVKANLDGTFPEGSLHERVIWGNTPSSQVPGATMLEKIRNLQLANMDKARKNKKL